MNRWLIAPIAVIVAGTLKQHLGLDVTETEIETLITVGATIVGGIWAAVLKPRKEVK